MSIHHLPSVGPYTWVSKDVTRGRYRILVYGAFNAFGLIGSECNGIAVLDNKKMCVVADQLFSSDSGYFGPSRAQLEGLQHMLTCDKKTFCNLINSSGRNRFDISPATVAAAAPVFELV